MNASLWMTSADLPAFGALDRDATADILVIGGGIAGLTTALLLQEAGRSVMVVDANRIGMGETGYTTAHITEILDVHYADLEHKFGQAKALLAAESSRAAIKQIEEIVERIGAVDSAFSRLPGYLFAATPEQRNLLDSEFASLRRMQADVSWTDSTPLPFETFGSVRIENQAQFHPLAYIKAQATHLVNQGGQIFENTRVLDVEDGNPCSVKTQFGTVKANAVFVLTNVPISNRVAIHTKIAAYRTYVIAAPVPSRPLERALYWDFAKPYHYIRQHETRHRTSIVVGGEDHKTGHERETQLCWLRLENYARENLGIDTISHRWSGQIIEPCDGLPYVGVNTAAKNIYVATGFSGTGMTFGTLAAMILRDQFLKRDNRYSELYDATRVNPLAQSRRFVNENVDYPKEVIRNRIATGEVKSADEIPAGEGRVMRVRGHMLAVYRDDTNNVHVRSAVCTHLGCFVKWNTAEKSWDCPCHGSRFGVDGKVINGPATRELEMPTADQQQEEKRIPS